MSFRWLRSTTLVAAASLHVIVAQQEDSPWWAAISAFPFPQLYATDLEEFVPQLKNSTADYVLIDFYAPWCPHCQHFAPDYERLALAIQRFDAAEKAASGEHKAGKKPTILSATVNCVKFADTCDFWGVHSYPTIMWGRREDWLTKAQAPAQQQDTSGNADGAIPSINVIEMDGTAESVAQWINNRTNFGLNISRISKREVVRLLHQSQTISSKASSSSSSAPAKKRGADVWDAELATALFIRDILQHHAFEDDVEEEAQKRHETKKGRKKHVKPGLKSRNTTRSAFFNFVGLLGKRFPDSSSEEDETCRESLSELHEELRDNWASLTQEVRTTQNMNNGKRLVMIDPDNLERQWQMCGKDWSRWREGWHQCRGTWPGKRGFTCGLWNMFHFLAAQTTDETALNDLKTVRNAIAHFFDCEECRDHFMSLPVPEPKDGVFTRRDAQLWWWNSHNMVNTRVGKLEEMYDDGDPGFVKSQWPSEADCPKCRQRRLRLRGTRPGTIALESSASGTVKPVEIAPDSQSGDVPLEIVTLDEAVKRENWNLDEVAAFLDRQYRGEESLF